MDGVEATRIIREEIGTEYAKTIPVIALTANAIVGNEEMFLQKGFQAFISKPIEIAHLDAVIREWVRDKEQEKLYSRIGETQPATQPDDKNWQALEKGIPGLDIEKGLARFYGDKNAYVHVLHSYAKNTLSLLETSQTVDKNNLMDYATVVHGIKGSSGGICAEETAAIAEALENAALNGDYDYIINNNEKLAESARSLITNLNAMLDEISADNQKPKKDKPDDETLKKLLQACMDYEMGIVDTALEELEIYDYASDGDLVAWLRENAELMNFDEIIERLSVYGK
jgi:CheY-like chemotaxis protein